MSGKINSAGSRSGIISRNELDYQEGLWTPTNSNYTMSAVSGRYVKTGTLVIVWGKMVFSATTSGSTMWSGLPFTCNADAQTTGWGGTSSMHNIDFGGTQSFPRVAENSQTWNFYGFSDGGGFDDSFNVTSGDQCSFVIFYKTD